MKSAPKQSNDLRSRTGPIIVIALVLIAVAVRLVSDRRSVRLTPADLERAMKNNPTNIDAQLNWGAELHREGRLDDAKVVFRNADSLALQDARAEVWLAMIAVQQHNSPDAIDAFQRALTRDPNDADVWLSLGDLQQASGALKDAEQSFETVTRLQPSHETAWRLLGELDVRRKLLARGREALETAVRLAPQDTKAQAALGGLDLRLGRLPEARAALRAAAAQNPPDAVALAQLAQADMRLDASPASLQSAMDLITKSLAIKITADGLLARGQAHLFRREYRQAIKDLNSAIGIDKQMLVAYGYLSQAYGAVGDVDKAKRASEQYMVVSKNVNDRSGDGVH